jgi:hypothetical protein
MCVWKVDESVGVGESEGEMWKARDEIPPIMLLNREFGSAMVSRRLFLL